MKTGLIDLHRRADGAQAQAIDRLDRQVALMALRPLGQSLGADGLTGFGAADAHDMPSGRRLAEMAVIADDAMHFGMRKTQRTRHLRHQFGRNAAMCFLDVVQDRQQRTFAAQMPFDELPGLVERRIAACVNIGAAVESVYRWAGGVETATETPMLIKTAAGRYADLQAALREHHPYDVPEIIALPVAEGLPAYLDWVEAETRP